MDTAVLSDAQLTLLPCLLALVESSAERSAKAVKVDRDSGNHLTSQLDKLRAKLQVRRHDLTSMLFDVFVLPFHVLVHLLSSFSFSSSLCSPFDGFILSNCSTSTFFLHFPSNRCFLSFSQSDCLNRDPFSLLVISQTKPTIGATLYERATTFISLAATRAPSPATPTTPTRPYVRNLPSFESLLQDRSHLSVEHV